MDDPCGPGGWWQVAAGGHAQGRRRRIGIPVPVRAGGCSARRGVVDEVHEAVGWSPLGQGDALLEGEHVVRVVCALDPRQSRQVRAVVGALPVLQHPTGEVDIRLR